MKMTDCKYKLRKLSVGLVSVGTLFTATTVMGEEVLNQASVEATTHQTAGELSSSATVQVGVPLVTPTNTESEVVEVTAVHQKTLLNQESSASETAIQEPQLMEVEELIVDQEKTELVIKDEKDEKGKSRQLIKNRDGIQRDIVDISRAVKVNAEQNELEVTLTVSPKEIDKGAEVIVLLDTSQKMTEDSFKLAKDNITTLVNTLTSDATSDKPNFNSRNSVRLIDFYRNISEPVQLTTQNVEEKLNEAWSKAKKNRDWGVNLQGAIHKARETFNKDQEKNSGKRQHIVLFSQGESTFSYDINSDKSKLPKKLVKDPVTATNPLLPWPFYFDSTTSRANLVEAGQKIQDILKKLGITRYDDLRVSLASTGNSWLGWGSDILGTNNPLDYITLADLRTEGLTEDSFNYNHRLGEGYHHRSYYIRETESVPLESTIKNAIKEKIIKLNQPVKETPKWWDPLGLTSLSRNFLNRLGFNKVSASLEEQLANKVIDYMFYKRNYVYYNHNLSAQAEAKMAREEGIVFYSFDVTDPKFMIKALTDDNSRKTKEEIKEIADKQNEKFDDYLKAMSQFQKFITDLTKTDQFQDILTKLDITENITDKVNVKDKSWEIFLGDSAEEKRVNYTKVYRGWLSHPEKLTWNISKEQLQKAFESGNALTLTYKLDVKKDEFKKLIAKASTKSENAETLPQEIISNTISYAINDNKVDRQKLAEVKLSYRKSMVPVPEIKEELVDPKNPSQPEVIIESGPVLDYIEENTVDGVIIGGDSSKEMTLHTEENTKSETTHIIMGGSVIDYTEDSITGNQLTESGQNASDSKQVIIEDTMVDMKEPEIIIGGQANIIDMTEDTSFGMHGFNEGTVIEEDTRPKLQFHFDNEEPTSTIDVVTPQTPLAKAENKLPQMPVAKVENNLPQTGEKDKLEAFFTISALTVIGGAGLLSKKNRKDQID